MATQQLIDLDFNSVAKAINLPTPTAAGDVANKAYVDAQIEGLAWKDGCRVSTQGDLNLASPGATIDGISMTAGDRVLVRQQSTASQNGIYIWNGAATPATRAADASTSDELEAAVVTVEEGTDAETTWRQTEVNFTLDSGDVTWSSFGTSAPSASETTAGVIEIATQSETNTGTDDARAITPDKLANWSGRKLKHNADVGDGGATQYDITHNFGTRDVIIQVRRNSGNYDVVGCDMRALDTNTVRLVFAAAPTSNQFRVIILG